MVNYFLFAVTFWITNMENVCYSNSSHFIFLMLSYACTYASVNTKIRLRLDCIISLFLETFFFHFIDSERSIQINFVRSIYQSES